MVIGGVEEGFGGEVGGFMDGIVVLEGIFGLVVCGDICLDVDEVG